MLIANTCFAESYQYVVEGTGNGRKVTGYVTAYDNGTIEGSVDSRFVSGYWTGLGIAEVTDGENFYEIEVTQ
jgi:hypothetical protein